MTYRYWLPLSLAAVVGSSLAFACSSKFDSCEARRTCSPVGGSSGAGGDAGASAGEGASEEGGKGGLSSGEVSGSTGGSSGDAGSGGEGGALEIPPAMFDACSTKGAFACVEHAHAQRLACDGKVWQAGTTCGAGELCDSANGACVPIVPECASAKPGAVVCRGDILSTCGPDLVTTREEKTCAGLCKLGVCQAPICGDAKIEAGEDCDDPDATASGACLNCKRGSCGDGVVWAANGEQCDDGNKASGDGCSATCRDEPVELALGDEFSCARSGTGLIKCWGDNSSGQLGLGDTDSRGGDPATVPSRLSAIDLGTGLKAKSISAHGRSVCARLESGDVKCWGNNGSGQLGTGDKFDRGVKPKQMGVELSPIPLGDGLKAIGISSGGDHTCAVLSSGAVKCWGLNAYGQLGQGNPAADASIPMPVTLQRPVTAVSASSFVGSGRGGNRGGATCALLNNAMVQCWGYTQVVPHTSLTDADGSSGIGDYPDEMSSLVTFAFADSPVKSIVAGNLSAAILADGSLRLWGWAPSPIDKDLPVTLADPASAPAVQMGGKVTAIAVSESHACAILEGGDLKCWGSNNYGALGLGATLSTDVAATPKDLASVDLDGRGAWQVATSVNHTCAILKDGTLKCWGYNGHGQLGLGDTTSRGNTGTKLSVDAVSLSF